MKACAALILVLAAPLLAASIPAPPEDPADIRKSEERVGAFTLELEEYRDSSEWGKRFPHDWKKVRMIWQSADGLFKEVIEDNGDTVTASLSTSSVDGKSHCISDLRLVAYGAKPDARNYLPGLLGFLRGCGTEPARVKAYEPEIRRAAEDFPAASYRLRALALAAFGRLAPRCIEFSQEEEILHRSCVRNSKPVSLPPSKS